MTVSKTTPGHLTPSDPPAPDAEASSRHGDGAFETVLEERSQEHRGRPASRRSAVPRGRGPGGTTASTTPHAPRGESRPPLSPDGAGPATEEGSAREAAARHLLQEPEVRRADTRGPGPGGASPTPTPHASATVASPVSSSAIDRAARVEQIAQQIVRAAEVRLHGDGVVEARLQLDLGRLGRLNVALERTAEGQIRVTLEPTTAEARRLLQSESEGLARRLETRGLQLQELTVRVSEETLLRIEGGREARETASARPTKPSPEAPPTTRLDQQPPAPRRDDAQDHRGRRDHQGTEADEEPEEQA